MVVVCSSLLEEVEVFHAFGHIVVHIPVEFSVVLGVSKNCLVDSFNSSYASFVFLNCSVYLADK